MGSSALVVGFWEEEIPSDANSGKNKVPALIVR